MNIFAGAGFAVMANKLAQMRMVSGYYHRWRPHERRDSRPGMVSFTYYEILDRATAHWQATSLADINTRCVL